MGAYAIGVGELPVGVLPGAVDAIKAAIQQRPRRCGAGAYANGLHAEASVRRHLHAAGYEILGDRVRTAAGEIDILAHRDGTLVAVEVKASRVKNRAASAVDAKKQERVAASVGAWLSLNPAYSNHTIRFDVAICDHGGNCDIIENAFFSDRFVP